MLSDAELEAIRDRRVAHSETEVACRLVAEVDRLRAGIRLAKEWLAAEDAFVKLMDEATAATWHPSYSNESWERTEAAREALRAWATAEEKTDER